MRGFCERIRGYAGMVHLNEEQEKKRNEEERLG
jgi:hypothetical protein